MIIDQRSIDLMRFLYPEFEKRARRALGSFNARGRYSIRVNETLRGIKRQEKLFAIGRTVKGAGATEKLPMGRIVTKAEAWKSYHHYGLAICCVFQGADPYLLKEDKQRAGAAWQALGACFTAEGLTWGGRWGFGDMGHAELQVDIKLDEMKRIVMEGGQGLLPLWTELDRILGVPRSWGGAKDFSRPATNELLLGEP